MAKYYRNITLIPNTRNPHDYIEAGSLWIYNASKKQMTLVDDDDYQTVNARNFRSEKEFLAHFNEVEAPEELKVKSLQ